MKDDCGDAITESVATKKKSLDYLVKMNLCEKGTQSILISAFLEKWKFP